MERRRVIPLRTELEYAPTEIDHLAEVLGGLSCSRDIDCRIQNCYQDDHHVIYGQDMSEVEQLLKQHPDMKARLCRAKHERVHRTWDRSEPVSDEFGLGYLIASPTGLSKNKQRELRKMLRGKK